ncbi:conjugal transfer peptidase TraF (plasmid) [Variovorax sp. SRS16]|uniref:conjugative transfer signal peptidase TraF n=1 Tax=Variovorax sp. SRS16 TaxID=282217 RepID=UPI001319060D|nr:conjugative transfer signal peptidase TraF [Variovorax sp. SRS16]VTU46121.1 conjugal transfer peptidase TraF [Variovorax sp. SRS16]
MSWSTRLAKRGAIGATALFLFALAIGCAGARLNTTPSIPIGLYWRTTASVERGAYVMFCPPAGASFSQVKDRGYVGPGFCPGGYGYLMKRVLAAGTDRISVRLDGVRVNGALLPLSAPLLADKAGRPLAHFQAFNRTLGAQEVLPMSDVNPLSYDGRYFGPITRSQIEAVIVPVLTW